MFGRRRGGAGPSLTNIYSLAKKQKCLSALLNIVKFFVISVNVRTKRPVRSEHYFVFFL